MRKAIATFGTGRAAPLLSLALPTFVEYCDRHGYDLIVGAGDHHGRPASWGKIPLLQRLLESYDFVLWIDSDALIIDASVDMETVIPADAFQAIVVHPTGERWGSAPCCGVWAFRSGDRARRFLAQVWGQEDLIQNGLWEQAAMMRLTGWRVDPPWAKVRDSDWDDGTFFLPKEWDMVPGFFGYGPAKIRHYTPWPYRLRRFDMRTDLAQRHGRNLRHRVGLIERRWRPVYYEPFTGDRSLRDRFWLIRRGLWTALSRDPARR